MADLSLKIRADFNEAQQQFKALAESSEFAQKQIESFSKRFTDKQIDEFIDKQKMAANAITATKGSLAAAEAQNTAYKREIERLIKSGLEPNSAAVQKLVTEQKKLEAEIKKTTDAQKAQEQALKNAEKAARACFAAIGAGIAAVAALTQKTAEAGDAAAKASRTVGMTAEAFQELQYAAKQSGVSDLTPSLQKLNKTIADVKSGSGALTKALEGNNDALLKQLKGAKSNEQAFNLLMNAIKNAPDEFSRAELATAAFGKAGQDLIIMAENGTEGIAALREEAQKYGVISNEAARASEQYMDAQTRLKAALNGVSTELTAKLMPGITEAVDKLANFINGVDNWEGVLKAAGIALASTTAALTAFIVVSKGHAIVTAMATAIKGFMIAITGPAGIAAVAIGSLVAVIGTLVSLNRSQISQGEIIAAGLNEQKNKADQLLSAYNGLTPAKNIDARTTEDLLRLYPELSGVLNNNALSVNDVTEAMRELADQKQKDAAQPFLQNMNKAIVDIRMLEMTIKSARDNASRGIQIDNFSVQQNDEKLAALRRQFDAFKNDANAILRSVGLEVGTDGFSLVKTAERELSELNSLNARNAREDEERKKRAEKAEEERKKRAAMSMTQALGLVAMTETQALNERINQAKSFLLGRAELERVDGEERIKAIETETQRILNSGKLQAHERTALERAAALAIKETREDIAKDNKKIEEEARKALNKTLANLEYDYNVASYANNVEALEAKKALLTQKLDEMKSIYKEGSEELINAQQDYNLQMIALDKQLNDEQRRINDERKQMYQETIGSALSAISGFAEASLNVQKTSLDDRLKTLEDNAKKELEIENLTAKQKKEIEDQLQKDKQAAIDEANNKAHGAAVAQRAIANAEAVVQTYLAASKALAAFPPPGNYIAMAATIAAGLANVAKINTTPIPKLSAETGGRFIVPDLSPRSDGVGMRVNAGERITVEPRGEYGSAMVQNINLIVDGVLFAQIMNKQIRAGEINLRLAGNL